MSILEALRRLGPVRQNPDGVTPEPEADLRLSMVLLDRIVEIAADAIISTDERYRIILFNRGAEEIFGYARDEILGQPLDALIPDRFRGTHRRHMSAFGGGADAARRMGDRRQIAALHRDGHEFPAEASISRVDGPGGTVFTVVLRDVTERQKVEDTQRFLAEAGEVLARSLDYTDTLSGLARLALPHLADWCTIDVLEEGELIRLEAAHRDPAREPLVQALCRYPPAPGRRHPARTVLDSGEPELVESVSEGFLRSLAVDDEHLGILHQLGAASLLAIPLTARGRTLGAFTLISADPDRTYGPEERALALELGRRAALAVDNARLYREARDAIAVRDEVLGVVSHDLGNPLSAIRVSVRVIERLLESGRPEGVGEHARGIRDAALQMERLIRDLLEIRRIESGRLRLVRRPEAVAALVEEAARALRPLADEQGVALEARVEPGVAPSVDVDADRVQQVFSNLIGNALKFTPRGGSITVSAEPAGDAVRFAVEDTGRGIAEDELPHVFDRFWQAHRRGSHGVGLGLAIAKGMVEAHGGEIDVASRPGSGTRFTFTIGAAKA